MIVFVLSIIFWVPLSLVVLCMMLWCLWKNQMAFYLYSPPKHTGESHRQKFRQIGDRNVHTNGRSTFSTHWLKPTTPKEGSSHANESPLRGMSIVLLYLHGNASDIITDRKQLRLFTDMGIHVIYLDPRGYADNAGYPTERGLISDAKQAIKWITNNKFFSSSRLFIYGVSLGGALAFHVLNHSSHWIDGMIVVNTFTSMHSIVKNKLCCGCKWISYMINERWDNLAPIRNHGRKTPCLFISSNDDTLIPRTMMYYLHQKYPCETKVFFAVDGGHNDVFSKRVSGRIESVMHAIAQFVILCIQEKKRQDSEDSAESRDDAD